MAKCSIETTKQTCAQKEYTVKTHHRSPSVPSV